MEPKASGSALGRRFSKEEARAIREERDKGASQSDLAQRYQCAQATVRTVLARTGPYAEDEE